MPPTGKPSPKPEDRRPKSEAPNPRRLRRSGSSADQAVLGFRVSAFFRISGLGLRISTPPDLSHGARSSSSACPPSRAIAQLGPLDDSLLHEKTNHRSLTFGPGHTG